MSKTLIIIWQYLRAFVLIYACLYAGIFLSSLLPIAIPGSIIGMLILFFLLALQILPAQWVNPGCNILIRYGAAVCTYRRRRHAVLGFTARAVWPGGGLLRDKHAGGLFSGQLEFTSGSR